MKSRKGQLRNFNIHRITVDAVLLKDRQVLLMKRSIYPHRGRWVLPGGHVEPGEDPAKAVKRELQEETGIKAEVIRFFNFYFINDRKIEPRGPLYNLVYLLKFKSGKIKNSFESSEIKWWPLDKLPRSLGFHHSKILKDYLKSLNG